jgi:sodium-dependent dicarboxylate transporter 2/3/5
MVLTGKNYSIEFIGRGAMNLLGQKRFGLISGALLFLFLLLLLPDSMPLQAQRVAAVAALMATLWISEAIPIAATALLPVLLFPLLGVMPTASVTPAYAQHLVFLFLGGFLIAVTLQRWNLHKRIALHTIRLVGVSAPRTVFGFMLASALLSMWISNTATTMMMLPIGIAVVEQLKGLNRERGENRSFGTVLMLGIAYASSIGGVATLIGTPPNAILAGMLEKLYGQTISFTAWLAFGLPLSAIMLVITWFYLTRIAYRLSHQPVGGVAEIIENSLDELGPMSHAEKRVMAVFSAVALLWISRGLFPSLLTGVSDASIAIAGALSLFVLSAGNGERLLDWKTARTIPWEILILFGGGFALAQGFSDSGLTRWLVETLSLPAGTPLIWVVMSVTLLVIFLTEVTSNTATATIVIPLLGALATTLETAPLQLMLPAAIAASYAFMLPVATPPNAIVFASGTITMAQMARCGFWLNLIATLLITLWVMIGGAVIL